MLRLRLGGLPQVILETFCVTPGLVQSITGAVTLLWNCLLRSLPAHHLGAP